VYMGLAHNPLGVLITIAIRVRVCTVTFYPTTVTTESIMLFNVVEM
jgi:hypothetical protein